MKWTYIGASLSRDFDSFAAFVDFIGCNLHAEELLILSAAQPGFLHAVTCDEIAGKYHLANGGFHAEVATKSTKRKVAASGERCQDHLAMERRQRVRHPRRLGVELDLLLCFRIHVNVPRAPTLFTLIPPH